MLDWTNWKPTQLHWVILVYWVKDTGLKLIKHLLQTGAPVSHLATSKTCLASVQFDKQTGSFIVAKVCQRVAPPSHCQSHDQRQRLITTHTLVSMIRKKPAVLGFWF